VHPCPLSSTTREVRRVFIIGEHLQVPLGTH
jgi:hypothetical protein